MKSKTTNSILNIVDDLFDKMSISFLGFDPKSKTLDTGGRNLISIFMKGLNSTSPTADEKDVLKTSLQITKAYIDGLKSRTQTRILDKINSEVESYHGNGEQLSLNKIREIMGKEFSLAGNNFKLAINSEANKIRNMSTALKIEKLSTAKGIPDPYVFWIVTLDEKTADKPEKTLHLIPGTTTPRVWKLSEIKHEFWKKGMTQTSIYGGHPHCRCVLTYLAPGWGFDAKGKVKYRGRNHDERAFQKKHYNL